MQRRFVHFVLTSLDGCLHHFLCDDSPGLRARADNGVTFSRSLNLDVPNDFGYTGLACGLIGAPNGTDCAVLYKTKSCLRFKRFASADVN